MIISKTLGIIAQLIMILASLSIAKNGIHKITYKDNKQGIADLMAGTIFLIGAIESIKYILL